MYTTLEPIQIEMVMSHRVIIECIPAEALNMVEENGEVIQKKKEIYSLNFNNRRLFI